MKLLAISSPEFIPDEAAIINSLFREGLECMHIRKPESKSDHFAKLLSQIHPDFLDRISIHQHHELAIEFGIRRLHLTESQRRATSEKQLKELDKKGFTLSTSLHDLAELENISTVFSYTFFGPVFDSISKSGYRSALPVDFFMQDECKRIPVIGLGGIDISNIQKVRDMNFDGAAVLGVLWRDPSRALEIFRMLSEYQDPCPERAPSPTPGLLPWVINKLQFISNETNGLSHMESIQIALDAGCDWIQLRVKDQPADYVLQKAIEAKTLCDQYQAKLIINDFPSVAKEVEAYGLHLGLSDMSISEARKIVGANTIIGGTANTLENILDRITDGADYVGLGPFQYTTTKQNLSPIVGLEGYRSIMNTLKELGHSIPVIAIGGITVQDIPGIIETGIHGIAISGSIINSENPKNLVSHINQILC